MKRFLATTTILALSAGFASAEVTLSGDARMGIISDFGGADTAFTSRARVKFTLSGESDSGFSFGASFRANNAADAAGGTAGEVFISGAFGTLSMGDVDGAATAAVGHVDGVGMTGLGDLNESTYIGNGGSDLDNGGLNDTVDPSALYAYTSGDLSVYLSVTNPVGAAQALALGAKYTMGNVTMSAGYEDVSGNDAWIFDNNPDPADVRDTQHLILGVDATFGAVTMKARYGSVSSAAGNALSGLDGASQMSVSATYTMDAMALTAFYSDREELGGSAGYGLGASYDLGGGASVVGGYVQNQTTDDSAFDLGLSFSF